MQSITRKHWLTVKAGLLLLAAAACGGAVSGLVTWWSGPDNALQLDAFKPGRFDIMGIVPVGYSLFAMALGIATGALLRRTLPAMAATLAVFIAVRIAITQFIRPHYMTAITTIYNLRTGYTPPGSDWQFTQGVIAADGKHIADISGLIINGVPVSALPASCQALLSNSGPRAAASCVRAANVRGFITYQPASRYWAFQGIETGIFVLLAAALIALAAIVVLRRDA